MAWFMGTGCSFSRGVISPPVMAMMLSRVKRRVGPSMVASRALRSRGLPTRILASWKDSRSMGPEGETPNCS